MAIRDTSAQDTPVAAPAGRRRRIILVGLAGIAAIAATTVLFADWRGTSQSVSAARVRVAPVARGTLVRDAAVNGRVVAAVSPTLASTIASVRASGTRSTSKAARTPA